MHVRESGGIYINSFADVITVRKAPFRRRPGSLHLSKSLIDENHGAKLINVKPDNGLYQYLFAGTEGIPGAGWTLQQLKFEPHRNQKRL